MVIAVGATDTVDPFKLPGIQTKVVPVTVLPAVREDDDPLQIAAGVATVVMTGTGLTVRVTKAEPVHPDAVPLTVYVVVVAGATDTGDPLKLPGNHANVVPAMLLLALKDADAPLQIAAGVAAGVITGFGFTVTVTEAVPVQPAVVPVTV